MTYTELARSLVRAFPGMTDREADCASLVAGGMDNATIARTLGLAEATVKVTLLRVPARMGVRNGGSARVRMALAAWTAIGSVPGPVGV